MTISRRLPVEAAFSITPFMSQGAMNWPFLTFTTLPVRAASSTRSVWRQRKAGIWSTSATCGRLLDLRDLVDVGEDGHAEAARDAGQDLEPALEARGRGRSRGWSGWPCRSWP